MGAEAVFGLAAWAAGRRLAPRVPAAALRVLLPALLVVLVTVWPAWWFLATRGTLDGYPGDSGLCPASNVPPRWPAWIPA
ncbi:hypothetical protein ACIA6T_10440 [Streptomyces sp. NPDC051740]|uniref:hypothetical protein n=1 Tax=Streptomyces sp. NPDC051740 TaxID=3365673 RepID=UPI0037BD629F